jgi:hypothetical protein
MSIQKSQVEKILRTYDASMKLSRSLFWGPHPAISAAKQLLDKVEDGPLSEEARLQLILCFMDNPVTEGGGSDIAYNSILKQLRDANKYPHQLERIPKSVEDSDSELANIKKCLIILKETNCLTLKNFQYFLAYPYANRLYAQLNKPGISPDKINQILNSLIPKERNPHSLFNRFPKDIRKILFSRYLSAQDIKSLSQTDSTLSQLVGTLLQEKNIDLQNLIKEAKEDFKTFFNHNLRLNPADRESHLKSRPDIIKPGDVEITQLLIHVVTGNIEAAEAMVQKNPNLLFKKGQVMDFSERFFVGEGIHPLHYALAAQDKAMTQMLLRYFPKTEEGEVAVASQYAQTLEMLQNEKAENHGAMKHLNASIDHLHQKLGAYIEKYGGMSKEEFNRLAEEVKKDWCEGIGGAYREQPAWLIETLCEKGEGVAWAVQDLTKPVKRDPRRLIWLFDREYNGGKSGISWAPARGRVTRDNDCYWARKLVGYDDFGAYFASDDRECVELCQSARPGKLPPLESLYSVDETPSMGPSKQAGL